MLFRSLRLVNAGTEPIILAVAPMPYDFATSTPTVAELLDHPKVARTAIGPNSGASNGVVFQSFNFPDTNTIVEEKIKGILHWSSVMFAVKDKYEKQIIKDNATINLIDVSVNEIFRELATKLKEQSKHKSQK